MTSDTAQTHRRAVLYLILTATLWSTSGLLVKVIDWQPMSILAGRSLLAACVFAVYLRDLRFRPSRVQIVGAAAFLATQVLFITATKMTTAANAIFLQYTAPVTVIPLSVLWLGERPTRADWVALIAILAGLGFFFGDDLSLDGRVGNILAIVSGVTMAVMTVCMRRAGMETENHRAPAQTILMSHVTGALIGMPSLTREAFTLPNLGIIAFLGLFQIGLAFLLYSSAVRHVHALETTLIVTLEPILNPLWVFLVIGEMPGPMALLGGALVIGAVTYRSWISARRPAPQPDAEPVRS
jgi:drug/metabolite transporter (DMT)-like permease